MIAWFTLVPKAQRLVRLSCNLTPVSACAPLVTSLAPFQASFSTSSAPAKKLSYLILSRLKSLIPSLTPPSPAISLKSLSATSGFSASILSAYSIGISGENTSAPFLSAPIAEP